jgi:hypothetical protein
LHHQYNKTARDIWHRFAGDYRTHPGMTLFPMQRHAFAAKPDLLLVGMNPSFAFRARDIMRRHLRWRDAPESVIQQFTEEEAAAREHYRVFYGPQLRFKEAVAAHTLEHLDLLPIRHTSQAEVVHAYWDKQGHPHAITQACFELFKETLLALAPTVVVVANAEASRQVRRILPLQPVKVGRDYGWPAMPHTTFFLSGMLSGQRALDEFSRARLEADVRSVLHPP